MTTDLEKKFFDTFGIEPKKTQHSCCGFWEKGIEPCPEIKELQAELKRKEQECEHWKHQAELGSDTTDRLAKELEAKEQECERLKSTLKVIADRPCLNMNDCNGNCLPHCKWNAHKLAQQALKELE